MKTLTVKDLKVWVKALRSGRYKQGRSTLRRKQNNGYGYCCLGVLAQVNGATWRDGGNVPFIAGKQVSSTDSNTGFLSPSFCGLSRETQITLANLNDGKRGPFGAGTQEPQTFKQIADYIEKRIIARRKKKQ